MASGHGVPKPRREGEANRQVPRDRFGGALYGGSADAMVMTHEAQTTGDRLAQMYTPFRSFNATRGPNDKWPGRG